MLKRPFIILIFALSSNFVYSQQSSGVIRKGLIFSFATGFANSHLTFPSKKQTSSDVGLNWKIGYMLNPRLALLINGSVSIYDYELSGRSRKRDFGGAFPSVQYHFRDRWWVLGGIGLGTDAPVFYDVNPENEDESKYHTGVGGLTAIGFEIYRRNNFAIDLQARFNYSTINLPIGTTHGYNFALLLGINFY